MDEPWLVVGLGNPGERYAGNRHNIGSRVADELAAGIGGRFSTHRARAQVVEGRLPPDGGRPGPRVVIAKPAVWMNESGGPVAGLLKFFSLGVDRLLVVHDEIDLAFGELRLKWGGGEGGHNGLRSISKSTGSKEYGRVRCGVGRPPGRMDAADYVLRDFAPAERTETELLVAEAVDAVRGVLSRDFPQIQREINAKRGS
jgi:PTH1 family peptidyl-tRNA hydrolase